MRCHLPIGRTPGCLSRGVSRHESRGPMELGSTSDEHILLATMVQISLAAASCIGASKRVHSVLKVPLLLTLKEPLSESHWHPGTQK